MKINIKLLLSPKIQKLRIILDIFTNHAEVALTSFTKSQQFRPDVGYDDNYDSRCYLSDMHGN